MFKLTIDVMQFIHSTSKRIMSICLCCCICKYSIQVYLFISLMIGDPNALYFIIHLPCDSELLGQ